MKILIVGAGIISSIYGWAMADAGHSVAHFVRWGKASQFANGIQIDILVNRKGKRDFIRNHLTLRWLTLRWVLIACVWPLGLRLEAN
jgi:2-dehydropantoate 2-reductase